MKMLHSIHKTFNEGKTKRGHEAVINAAKILAGTVFDLIDNVDLLFKVKQEFHNRKDKMSLV